MINNQWYAIIPSEAIKMGKVIGIKRLNMNLVLFRNAKGELGCLRDKCSHRGAKLSKGVMKGDCVQCPFHGIEFDRSGKCTKIPALGKVNTDDYSRFHIEDFNVREENGIVFLWYGERDKATKDLPFFYDEVDESYTYSELADLWKTHYSRAIENQLDVVHLPFIHHNTIGRGKKVLVNGPKVIADGNTLKTSADNEVDRGQIPKNAKDAKVGNTYIRFRFPNIWVNHVSDKLKILVYFAPVDEKRTVLYIRFYHKFTKSKFLNRLIAFIGKYMNQVIERQDKRIVITQEPKITGLKIGENLISGDSPIILYRKIREQLQKEQKS